MSTVTVLEKIDSIAIGGFDGMHIGHQHLFDACGKNGAILVIETGYANLTPGHERENFTDLPVYYYDLENIRHLDGEAFIAKIQDQFPALRKIVIGYDFHFGKHRKSSIKELQELFRHEVEVIDEVTVHDDSVHSHKIRAKLKLGDIHGANLFLGHNYTIRGAMIKGQGLGKRELVATINLKTEGFLLPREGVYTSLTRIDGDEHYHPSVSFIGHRVSTDGSFAVETHILDGDVDCKRRADISFVDHIRDNQQFDSLKALKEAIESDIAKARKRLMRLSL